MSKKQYIGFIILAVVVFGGLFYWYSFRPSLIKKDCYKETIVLVKKAQHSQTEVYKKLGQLSMYIGK